MSEADIHFEFYRYLANAISDDPSRDGFKFGEVRPEYGEEINGFADIVIFEDSGKPFVVIEAKAPSEKGHSRRDIDPYAPKVIRQAFRYAGDLGAPYFCTFNGDRLVVFDAYEEGVPLLQRSTKSYQISNLEKFSDTFLDEIARIRSGKAKWDSNDDAFIERVRSIHEQIAPDLEHALAKHINENQEFREDFIQWTKSQAIEYEDAESDVQQEVRAEFADQAAYLLINKIIFYKLLEDSPTYSEAIEPLAVSPFRVQRDLEEYFNHLVDKIDFEAVFEHDEIYGEIPLDSVSDRIRDFVIELDGQNLRQFNSDVIGRIYEGVIPPKRRHDLGEYYTPPAICDLITNWTIQKPEDEVLDPACGSGGFLVSAYHRKKELVGDNVSHDAILNELFGIDINRFPAHLTAINLAIQDLSSYTEHVNIEVNDFFNVSPGSLRFHRERASSSGSKEEEGVVGGELNEVDAVVANPPYVRGRNIDNDKKDDIREHLTRVGADDISRRMDLYGYFLTHSTEFLRDGGRLGFITSDRWLDTGYGAELQEFVLDNYCIEAIIKLDRQAFDDALVGSSILLLTMEDESSIRDENIAKFIRVQGYMDLDELGDVIDEKLDSDILVRDENFRIVTRKQGILREEEKWTTFFRAPPIYYDLFGNEATIELQNRAHVERGITSGANDFFYARREDWEDLDLEEYTTPLLKASGQVSRIRCTIEDAGEWGVLDIHDLVSSALEVAKDRYEDVEEEEFVKDWLKREGHQTLVEYINSGEDNGFHKRPTTEARTVWFDLGDLTYPPMFIPDFTWRVHRVLWSEVDAVSDRQFYHIVPDSGVDSELLCAILNSRAVWLMCELRGRWSQGQRMSRSEIKVYEAKELPIPDPLNFSQEEADSLKDVFHKLMEKEDELDEDERTIKNTEPERDRLDRIILTSLGMSDKVEELKEAINHMIAMREKEGGEKTDVLVSRPVKREVIELEGVEAARESTTLADF